MNNDEQYGPNTPSFADQGTPSDGSGHVGPGDSFNTGPQSGPGFVSQHQQPFPSAPGSQSGPGAPSGPGSQSGPGAPSGPGSQSGPGAPSGPGSQSGPGSSPDQGFYRPPTPVDQEWGQQPWPPTQATPLPPPSAGSSGYGPGTLSGPTALATAPGPKRRVGTLIGAVALAAVVGAGAGIGTYSFAAGSSATTVPISVTTSPASSTPVLNGTIEAAAKKIEPSVVTITVQSGQSGDIGTGVVLDKAGHILTNNHVVEAAAQNGKITVTMHDGTTTTATLVGASTANDLAVIKVDGVKDLQPATFAKSGSLKVGQSVVAAGAPLGLSETVTSGIVSNTTRAVRSGSDNSAVYMAVQTDTAINPGNSGGPLVDLNGSVVGINSSIAGTSSGQTQPGAQQQQSGNIGIGFAIPSDVATRVAADIVATGKAPDTLMGVTVAGSDSTDPTATGVKLQSVTAGSAAGKAGLKAGDEVTKLNDFATTSADALIAATRYYAPGTHVSVTYQRGGESHTTEVTLGTA